MSLGSKVALISAVCISGGIIGYITYEQNNER